MFVNRRTCRFQDFSSTCFSHVVILPIGACVCTDDQGAGRCSLANNDGLCGLGLRSCNNMSHGMKTGIVFAIVGGFIILVLGGYLCWKRRMNMIRGAQRLRKSRSLR